MGLKEDYRLKKLKKEMHRLHCEITKCCDGEGGDGLSCEDLENCQEIIDIKDSIPTNNSELLNDSNYLACEDLETCQEIIDIKDSIPTDVSDLTDTGEVLFSGDYNDLDNKPTFKTVDGQSIIGAGDISVGDSNVQSDWNEADPSSDAFIKNKPSIPIVNDGQLELNTSGIATGGTENFSANQSGNTTFTVNVPGTDITLSFNNNILTVSSSTGQSDSIDLSSLATDNTYVTSMSLSGNTLILTNNDGTTVQQDLSSILFDGDYNSLTNTPTFKTVDGQSILGSGDIAVGGLTCEDLENCQEIIDIKDSIPTDVSDLSDNGGLLLEYKGEQSSAPLSPQKGWFYKNTVDGVMYYFDGTNWIAYAEGGGANILIERSLPDLHIDISNNELVPGATYKITGVHKEHTVNGAPVPALYDDGRGLGTTIFLKAVSENKLENSGSGIFYNPNYDLNTQGYGIWTNKVFVTLSNVLGNFDLSSETVTTDNGATGKILTKGWIEYISGDWANATSITGDSSGATADINAVSVPSYNVNDVVFWGGYAWKNLNGNVGSSTDILNLDSEWEKLDYTDSNYNEVVDYIEYDIDNDFITRRRNEEYNIDVNETFDTSLIFNFYGLQYSSISVMNYGLGFSIMATSGIMNVKINDSYLELVNFRGGMFFNVNFDNGSNFNKVNFDNGSFTDVNLDNGSFFTNVNFDNGSNFNKVNFDNGSSLQNVNFDNNSRFNNVNFDNNSRFNNVNFDNNSGFQNVNFDNYSSFSKVNFDNGSNFTNVNFNSSSFQGVNFDNYSSFSNVNFDGNSSFSNVNFDNGSNFDNVNFNSSYFYNVNFDKRSYFSNVNFNNGSSFQYVNFDNESVFSGVNFVYGSFDYVNFDNESRFDNVNFVNGSYFYGVNFYSFVISYGSATILLDGKVIRYTDFKGTGYDLSLPDLSSANIIFNSGIRKEVIYIQGATNDCKLITYDTNGDRVVNDIDD